MVSVVFNVGVEQTQFFAQSGNFMTLDPNANHVFSVYSKNHPNFRVRLYSVTPDDYISYRGLLREYYNNRQAVPAPKFGTLIFDKTIEVQSGIDVLTETRIDLSE